MVNWGDLDSEQQQQRINIDVGGFIYSSLNTTFSKSPYLFRILNEMHENESMVFIDRDPSLFYYILFYLRTGKIFLSTDDKSFLDSLVNEAKFYEIPNMIQKILDCHTPNPLISVLHELKASKVTTRSNISRIRENNW